MERAFVEAVLSRHWWRAPDVTPHVFDYDDNEFGQGRDMRTPTPNFAQGLRGAGFMPPINPLAPASFVANVVDDPAELDMILQLAPRETALSAERTYRAFRFASALRVQNEHLLEMFRSCASGEFRVGFHGTRNNYNYKSILTFGFTPHISQTSSYGAGTYLAAQPALCLSQYTEPMGPYVAVIMTACALSELKPYERENMHLEAHQGALHLRSDDFEAFVVQDYRRIYPAYVLLYEEIPGLSESRCTMQRLLEEMQSALTHNGLTPCFDRKHDLLSHTPSGEAVSWRRNPSDEWYKSRYERRYHRNDDRHATVVVELVCAFSSDGLLRDSEAIEAIVYVYQNFMVKSENISTNIIRSDETLRAFVRHTLPHALTKAG